MKIFVSCVIKYIYINKYLNNSILHSCFFKKNKMLSKWFRISAAVWTRIFSLFLLSHVSMKNMALPTVSGRLKFLFGKFHFKINCQNISYESLLFKIFYKIWCSDFLRKCFKKIFKEKPHKWIRGIGKSLQEPENSGRCWLNFL